MSATQTAVNSLSNVVSQPMKYLDKALMTVRNLGISVEPEDAPVLSLVARLEVIDSDAAMSVARVLQQSSMFNAIVRDHIDGMSLSDRYEDIAKNFDSIRKDSRRMLDSISDGKYTLREKIHQIIMRVSRGTIPARYQRIRETYLDVAKDSKAQIEKERAILEAYADYRLAMKSGEVVAHQLLEKADVFHETAKKALADANAEVTSLAGATGSAIANAEMKRDEALREMNKADKVYQLAKDIAENIKVSYATGEVVMFRLQQTTDIKDRVYQRSVTFFATNETVFTGLNAATTSAHGLHESTKVLTAMENGMNAGIEDLADIGGDILRNGVKAGYGPGLRSSSVKKLVDSVVEYQADLQALTNEMRRESTQNAIEVTTIVEDGKQRFVSLIGQA